MLNTIQYNSRPFPLRIQYQFNSLNPHIYQHIIVTSSTNGKRFNSCQHVYAWQPSNQTRLPSTFNPLPSTGVSLAHGLISELFLGLRLTFENG